MGKLIVFMMTSLDGYHEGRNRELDWHLIDDEFYTFAIQQLDEADILLFGRVTYELMAQYWPTELGAKDDPNVAGKMNTMEKLVFSKSLSKPDWSNTRLVRDDAEEEIIKLKQSGKNLLILGSSTFTTSLLDKGLLDEIRIMMSPILIGDGHPVFNGLQKWHRLKLTGSRAYPSGNILLSYQPG